MTVPVTPIDQSILQILQQSAPLVPFEELTHLIFDAHIPGRFGTVHTGRWKEHDVEIREPFGDLTTIEREVRLLYKLGSTCPQIVHLYGYTIDPHSAIAYLVVQHNEHGSLHSYLANFHAHLTWPDRYNLAMDIALGLRYIHYRGYRHRHLHSASILIDTNGSAVLSDFGSTRDSEVLSSREHPPRMGYIAPERLTKNGTRYSIECDIYSLGMVFWEISSGRPPFDHLIASCSLEDGTMMSLAQNIVSGRRERHVEGTDPIFEDLYTRCWHSDPLERPSIDWIIQTLGVLLKQPSGSLSRLIENLSLEEQPKKPAYSAKASSRDSQGSTASRSVKSSRSHSIDNDRDLPSPMLRSRELVMSSRESEYAPPHPHQQQHQQHPQHQQFSHQQQHHHQHQQYSQHPHHQPVMHSAPIAPPPVPPMSSRRKASTVSSMAPSLRSMSISSGSSTGSSSGGNGPMIPARDSRRVSTLSSVSSIEIPKYDVLPNKQRNHPQTIWEAVQDGNVDFTEWCILNGASPNGLISLPMYSMLAEVAPIHVACFYQPINLVAILKCLQQHGAIMQMVTTMTRQSALHIVLEHATNYKVALEVCSFLIQECHLSVNDQDNRGVTPFHKFLKNPHLSGRQSVAGSELFVLLRERGEANLNLESFHEGNALGMAARYLRVDLVKLFLLTDLSCSDPRSLGYALGQVDAPLSESRPSKSAQDLCRSILMEWTGERGESKRIAMAERLLEHRGVSLSAPGSPMLDSSAQPPKARKQSIGLLGMGIGKSKKSKEDLNVPAVPSLPTAVANEIDVARKILQSTVAKQQKLKTFMAQSGF
ncbi:MAG: kinase-like domain-containing protein [Linnemannia elongata]|nr:MAG: kinase-like domain-containing protein [Linnemannia elongata]